MVLPFPVLVHVDGNEPAIDTDNGCKNSKHAVHVNDDGTNNRTCKNLELIQPQDISFDSLES